MHAVPSSLQMFISLVITIITFFFLQLSECNWYKRLVALSMSDREYNCFKIAWKLSKKSFYPLFPISCQSEIDIC